MLQGSNTLTVASATGFTVGDRLIVEIGGETGNGQRGTRGVGGTWPALSYADEATMLADHTQTDGTFSWLETSGDVYRYVSGTWMQDAVNYYREKAIPLSLVANITNVVGNQITIDKTAEVATVAAAVYFDNSPAISDAIAQGGQEIIVTIPASDFAISEAVLFDSCHGWKIVGQGVTESSLFVPKGIFHSYIVDVYRSNRVVVQDLACVGNARNQGFGLGVIVTQTSFPGGASYSSGISFLNSSDGRIENCRVEDVFQRAYGAAFSDDVNAYNCQCVVTEPLLAYIQWMFQWSDSVGGGIFDCSVDSAYLTAGMEAFKSDGIEFIRPTLINAVMSMNDAGGWLIEDAEITIEADSQFSAAFNAANPIININTNIGDDHVAAGGTIDNLTMLQEGYVNAQNDSLRGIVINVGNPNITVQGGICTAPDYAAPSGQGGSVGLLSTGLNTNVDGLTVVGASGNGYANISVENGSVTNCTADLIDGP